MRTKKATPYSERQAMAEIRLAMKDLERAAARLEIPYRRLKTLPDWKRADAASRKEGAVPLTVAYNLSGSCWEVIRAINENLSQMRRDLRYKEEEPVPGDPRPTHLGGHAAGDGNRA